jgi:hypothetical protein
VPLPGAESAIVAEDKIRNYLLSTSHLEGRSKARFFTAFGFTSQNWRELAAALRRHVVENEAVLSKRNEYGSFYNVDGPALSPDGRNPRIRSVWVIETAFMTPRFITAHPIYDERT